MSIVLQLICRSCAKSEANELGHVPKNENDSVQINAQLQIENGDSDVLCEFYIRD